MLSLEDPSVFRWCWFSSSLVLVVRLTMSNFYEIFSYDAYSVLALDDTRSSFTILGSTPSPSSKSEDSSITPPEAWGGERLSDKYTHLRQPVPLPSRFGTLASGGQSSGGSMFGGLQDLSSSTSQTSINSLTNSNFGYANFRANDVSLNQETSFGFPEHLTSSSTSLSLGTKGITGQTNLDLPGPASSTLPRRFSTYAERISTASSFSDGTSLSVGSPKLKKTGAETREELLNNLLAKSDTVAALEPGILPSMNV
ncbi:hypothetical protein CMV_025993 [Castanea mollissima]|uniref:Uncharacterized protein n=1 Tax=Castanea mollissima TaxID=60419 RepID=A0A8J4QN44_9ROSI|nr:hypothetical protein CMV_025993 [Castanea mollissima]